MSLPDSSAKCSPQLAIARLGGRVDLYGELVERFLRDDAGNYDRLRDAVARLDTSATHQTAHSFKGSAAMCGADEVAAIAFQLEQAGKSNERDKLPDLLDQLDEALIVAKKILGRYQTS